MTDAEAARPSATESVGDVFGDQHRAGIAFGGTEDEIAQKTADVGAGISGRFDSDRAGLSMRTLSSRAEREQALDVYTRILHKPLFPQKAFEREKTRLLGALLGSRGRRRKRVPRLSCIERRFYSARAK